MTNESFGRLIVVSRASNSKKGEARWLCHCECGGQTIARGSSLRNGNTQSCGCYQRERLAAALKSSGPSRRKHGHAADDTREYRTWLSMKARCLNPNNHNYHLYGGRGIRVCERWLAFENFLADMGPKPAGLSLDRINNNGNYEPGNCRWATAIQQNNNLRSNRLVEYQGRLMTIPDAVRLAGSLVPSQTARTRIIRDGYSVERAVVR